MCDLIIPIVCVIYIHVHYTGSSHVYIHVTDINTHMQHVHIPVHLELPILLIPMWLCVIIILYDQEFVRVQ